MRLVDVCSGDGCSVLEHVFKVNQIAVSCDDDLVQCEGVGYRLLDTPCILDCRRSNGSHLPVAGAVESVADLEACGHCLILKDPSVVRGTFDGGHIICSGKHDDLHLLSAVALDGSLTPVAVLVPYGHLVAAVIVTEASDALVCDEAGILCEAVVHMLGEVVHIVEVDDPFLVGLYDVFREKQTFGKVLGDFAGHVVTLYAVDDWVLVGILLLCLFVLTFDDGKDLLIGVVCLSDKLSLVAVLHVVSCDIERTVGHELILDHILDVFDCHCSSGLAALKCDVVGHFLDVGFLERGTFSGEVCLYDGVIDF